MMDNHFSSEFGDLLKTARTRKHLTQKRLAQLLGVHYNTISSWEQGSYLPETRGLTMELARLLDMDQQETRLLLETSLMTLSPYWNVPYRRNPFFIGRDKVLQQLHEALHSADNTVLGQSCTLSGLAGIGKTQTAAEYAYRYADNYAAIFWIGSQTSESILSSFFSIASVLKLPERREQEQKHVVATVLDWLNSHDHWLLVFDDVEDAALVKRFLPAERRGFILFASRRQTLSISAHTLELEPMTPEEGIYFLLRRAGFLDITPSLDQLAARDEAAVREIVSLIDGWPLALDQAGSYIEATHCSLPNYLQLYQSSQLYLLNERSASSDHPQSVMKAVTLAFEQLEQQNTQAAALLTACSFLSFEPIPDIFFREGAAYLGPAFETLAADPSLFQTAIKASLMYSLIQYNADTQMISIHRLVQTILKGRLAIANQHQWVTRAIQAMSYLFPSEEMTQAHYWQNCEQMLPHALVCIASGEQGNYDEIAYITLMCHVAIYLTERARYAEAQQLLLQAANSEQMPAPDHPLTAKVFYHLGILYLKQGEYVKARSFLQRALSIRESALGVDHPLVAASLNGLSMLYLRQGEYAQAESLLERTLNIREQTLGDLTL